MVKGFVGFVRGLCVFSALMVSAFVDASVSLEYEGDGKLRIDWAADFTPTAGHTLDLVEVIQIVTDPATGQDSRPVVASSTSSTVFSGVHNTTKPPGTYRYYTHTCWNLPQSYSCADSGAASITIDVYGQYHFNDFNSGPDIEIVSPLAGAVLQPGITPIAVSTNGRVSIASVQFYMGDSLLGTQLGNSSAREYSFNLNTQSESLGYKRITVVATASDGATTTQNVVVRLGNGSYSPESMLGDTPIDFSQYDIYYGDVDGDGLDGDIYFHGKALFILLHGDVSIPLFIPGAPGFVYSNNGVGGYLEPWQIDLSRDELETLTLASEGVDFTLGDINADGNIDILLRGATEQYAALLLSGTAADDFAQILLSIDPEGLVTSTRYGSQLGLSLSVNPSNRGYSIGISSGQLQVNGVSYTFDTEALTIVSDEETDALAKSQAANTSPPSSNHMAQFILDKTLSSLSGEFRVNESGAASYTLPIKVAGGTAGVTPQVALSYNSQSGSGMLGTGWSLSAGGGITRCRQTLLVDGVAKPITWSDEDRFCINGARLLLVGGAGYGADGATYRTEIDSMQKVTSYTGAGGGVDYFTVTAKDGSISYYGAPGNHNSEWKGRNESNEVQNNIVYSWGLTTFKDNMGNTILYTYSQGNTHYRVDEIKYAYPVTSDINEQAAPAANANARIKFSYTGRGDEGIKYNAGYVFREESQLERIETYNTTDHPQGEEVLRTYHLEYRDTTPLRLAEIKECAGGSCLPSLKFAWGSSSSVGSPQGYGWVAPSGGNVAFVQHAFADINGDGRQDLFMVELTSANNYSATYALQNDDGSYDKQGSSWAINKEKDSDSRNFRISPIDINVDGRMDIALYIPGLKKWQLYLAEPTTTGTWRLNKTEFNFPSNSKDLAFADLNSDAVTDAYLAAKDGLKVYKLERQTDSSESSMAYSFDTVGESLNSTAQLDGKTIAFGDINGDGALDYIGVSRSMKNDNSYGDEEEGDILECDVRESLVVGLSVPGASDVEWNVVESVSEAGKIYSDQGMSCSTLASFTHATIGNIIVLDLNGDGVSDLLYAQKSLAGSATNIDGQVTYSSAYYRLGKGDGTFTDKTKFNNGVFKNFGLMDYDYDGKPDVYIRQKTENIELSKWNGLGFDVTANTIHTDVDSNSSIQYFDYTGDGSTDRITVEGDRIRYAQGRKEYARHKIYKINSGFGVATEVSYEPLSLTESYARVEGISVESINYEREYSPAPGVTVYVPAVKNVVDPTKFYGALNEPFTDVTTSNVALYKKVPVLEFMAPISVVTLVESSSPSYSTTTKKVEPTKAGVAYMYGEAKIQAGGRGFLGYKTLRTVDLQTLIETTTTYRQDWPFVGTPLKTVVKTPEGHRLSESETESRALLTDFTTTGIENRGDNDEPDADETNNYAVNIGAEHITDAMENGSGVLGPVQIFTYKQASKSFAFAEGQTSEGGLLKTSEVVTSLIDHYGNVKTVSTRHLDGSNVEQSAQTVNSYYFSTEALPLDIARLKRTVAVNSRPNTAEKRRTALFDYYGGGCVSSQHTGMLCSESVEVNDVAGTVTTTHYYDAFGNEVFNRQEADGQTRLSSLSVYGSDGRYPIKTYGVFSSEAGASVSTENGEYNGAINGSGSIQLTSEIVLRDKHGIPLQSHSYIGNGNYVTNRIAVTPFGNTILKSSSTGAYETFLGDFNVGACPSGSGAFYTISSSSAGGAKSGACFDILGRKVSTYKVGFSGTRTQTAVRYDILSRTIATSEPFIGVSTNYWTDIQYDTVGRVTETQHPFDTVTRTTTKDAPSALGGSSGERAVSLVSYNGLSTTFTNAENQTKTEVKNILGEITSVTEGGAGGRTARYEYDANGKLQKVLSEGVQITEIVYDGMGRKISMDDDDKGQWSYQYNGFGNLTCQEDGENNVIYNQYDIRGRLVARTDYINASCTNRSTDNITAQASWMYDKASNGLGKLASEQDTKSRYAKTYSYDNFGRISAGMDQFPGADGELSQHHQKVTYDQYGRTYQNFDAARVSNEFNTNGTQNVYNTYGYLSKVVNAANTSEKYYEVIGMNARGQVTTHTLGAAVRVNSSYKAESGLLASINSNSLVNNATLQNLSLKWDHLGNLLYRNESTFGSGWERYEYNGYNELANTYFVNGGSETSQSVTYDNFGNIKSKTGMGNYTYDPVKLHAVTSTANHSYRYDNNGNMLAETNTLYGEVEREFTYSAFNKATQVKVYDVLQGDETLKAQVNFSYGTGRNRFKRVDTNHENGKQTTTLYAGGVEKVYYADGTIEWKRNIAGVGQITQKVTTTGALVSEQKQYFLKDHLGSISVIMSDTAEVLQKMAFDPWGARRDLNSIESMTTGNVLAYYAKEAKPITSRGFTGHEMVDAVGIIHMNGRIYDAKLGRFLQADPFVQEPTMVGSLNRYSYIMNNPLNGVDPSGFNWVSDRWHASKDDIKPYAGLIVGTLLVIATGGASAAAFAAEKASWFVSSWYGAAALGGISGAVGSGVNGGNVMKGALFGAVSGAAFYGVGSMFADGGSLAGLQSGIKELVQGGMHGVTGGILADLQGGQFGHGFVSAGIAKGVSLGAAALTNSVSVQFVAAALAGGTASKMTGGKFANGAQSAAIAFVANHIQGLKRSVAQKGLDRHEGKEGYSHLESLDDITFENDVPGGPHTDRAIDTDLVNALHTSLDNSGLTVNVNSTTGGHGVGTPHYNGKAIDINQVGGVKVQFLTDNGLMRDVLILQRNLMMQPGVIKVFGPVYNYVKHNGNWIQANSHVSLRQSHSNHIHVQVE